MHTSNRIATLILAGGILATSAYAQAPTDLDKQLADLRTQAQAQDKQLAERQTVLKAQAPVAALVTSWESAESALNTFRKTDRVNTIETAKNKASSEYGKALEDAKKANADYTGMRAREKEAGTRLAAADITPEAKAEIQKELTGIKKQKEELLKTIKDLPAVAAAKSAEEAASKAYQEMAQEPEYAKLQQAQNEARNAMNKALEDAMKGDAAYNEIKTKRDDLNKQIQALAAQIQATKIK